jgi:hypothetical protein
VTASSATVTTGDPGHAVVEHSPVGGLAHDSRGGISNPILGMLLFICSEVMFFSGLFAAYFSVRASSLHWPPGPPQVPEAQRRVVVALADEEGDPEHDRHGHIAKEAGAVVPPDRPDRELAGERRDHEDHRQDEGEPRLGVEVEVLGHRRVLGGRRPGRRGGPDAEVGGEQPREEHDLRADEQDHPEDRVADPAARVVSQPGDRVVLGHGMAGVAGRHQRRG